MRLWSIWNNEECCWLRIDAITGSKVEPTLASATPTWFEEDAAYAAIPQIEGMTGLRDMEVRSIGREEPE